MSGITAEIVPLNSQHGRSTRYHCAGCGRTCLSTSCADAERPKRFSVHFALAATISKSSINSDRWNTPDAVTSRFRFAGVAVYVEYGDVAAVAREIAHRSQGVLAKRTSRAEEVDLSLCSRCHLGKPSVWWWIDCVILNVGYRGDAGLLSNASIIAHLSEDSECMHDLTSVRRESRILES